MSPGVSNSYAIGTDEGRVIVNGGLFFEGATAPQGFCRRSPARRGRSSSPRGTPTTGAGSTHCAKPDTDVVMHANYRYWRDDNMRLGGYRAPKTSFAFQKFSDAIVEHLKDHRPRDDRLLVPRADHDLRPPPEFTRRWPRLRAGLDARRRDHRRTGGLATRGPNPVHRQPVRAAVRPRPEPDDHPRRPLPRPDPLHRVAEHRAGLRAAAAHHRATSTRSRAPTASPRRSPRCATPCRPCTTAPSN